MQNSIFLSSCIRFEFYCPDGNCDVVALLIYFKQVIFCFCCTAFIIDKITWLCSFMPALNYVPCFLCHYAANFEFEYSALSADKHERKASIVKSSVERVRSHISKLYWCSCIAEEI